MKKLFFILLSLLVTSISFSQINELGFSVAGSNYIGDVGNTQYINPNDLAIGGVYKWNYNSRIVYRVDATYIRISADDANASNSEREQRGYSFKNSVKELAIGMEFNYYDFSMTREGWSSTPYLIVQLAVNNYNVAVRKTGINPSTFETEGKTTITIPFGIGYKTKIGSNIGIAIETKVRYTFADDLDYNNFDIKPDLSFGNPDSNDWYVTTGVTIVFGFGRKGCYSGAF
jgi:hypothetical protein